MEIVPINRPLVTGSGPTVCPSDSLALCSLSSGSGIFSYRQNNAFLDRSNSIDDDPEVEALSCWSEDLTPVAELSRLGVAVEYQNRGIARILLQEAMAELKSQG